MAFPAVSRGSSDDGSAEPVEGGGVRVLLIPLGATEQHGPHLPLATDTIIAAAWAEAAASQVNGVIVAPPLPYGSSGEHQSFPGTLSIGRQALEAVVTELVRSATTFCDRIVFVSGHGGNIPVLEPTIERLSGEGHAVSWVAPRWPPWVAVDAHAGAAETSLLLHLAPDLVGPFSTVGGNTRPLAELMAVLVSKGVESVSPNGVLGDPAGASAEFGAELFEHLVQSLVDHVAG